MIISFVLILVCALGLALFAMRFGISGWMGGLKLGRPPGLHLINGLYNVAGNIIAAIIICS